MSEKITAADAIRLLDAHEAAAVDVREPDEFAVARCGQAAAGWSSAPEGLQECQGQDLQRHRAAGHRTRWPQQVFAGI